MRGADESSLSVTVGPVDSHAALEWIDNTTRIGEAVRADPGPTAIAPPVSERFIHDLDVWRQVAEADDELVRAAKAEPYEVAGLLDAWASIDRIDGDALGRFGLQWGALDEHEATVALADRLRPQWGSN